jgi:RimJ/RimL family protein N-acetyltransferase
MRAYNCLTKQIYKKNDFSIVPLRDEDKYRIMQWRNEQVYHLRQNKQISKEEQEHYFATVIDKLFNQENPDQILFSYLENDICIGYGGLVHINWIDQLAEISFLINTQLEKEKFEFHWFNYLQLIEIVAFKDLNLHKVFTYAFDLRPLLYKALEKAGFNQEARLKEHCYFDKKYIDVLIHSKINYVLTLRKANFEDAELYFKWANDDEVRSQSFNINPIDWKNHQKWFNDKVKDKNCLLFLFETNNKETVGQVRLEKNSETNSCTIGISISQRFRGKKLASQLILKASVLFLKENPTYTINAYIKKDNFASIRSFEQAGFIFSQSLKYQGSESLLYLKTNL